MIPLILLAGLWLAYANGANDNFKGVATLFGTGTSDYTRAIRWATAATFAGSLVSLAIGASLVQSFSGTGLVPNALVGDPLFLASVGLGAAGAVLLATRLGLPVSTTHALLGALIGAGIVAQGIAGIRLEGLKRQFILPLLVSPLLALFLTSLLYPIFESLRRWLGIARETCVCIGEEVRVIATDPQPGRTAAAVTSPLPTITVGTKEECFERYAGSLIGIDAQVALDRFHYLSAGAVSFARGLNDTPKILALLVAGHALVPSIGPALVGLVIAAGGLLSARRVAETMSHRITEMNHGQGFSANLVTAFLVIVASRWGLPVSTTHVSCGSLFGIGLVSGRARWRTISGILLAWLTTLPAAALLAAGASLALKALLL